MTSLFFFLIFLFQCSFFFRNLLSCLRFCTAYFVFLFLLLFLFFLRSQKNSVLAFGNFLLRIRIYGFNIIITVFFEIVQIISKNIKIFIKGFSSVHRIVIERFNSVHRIVIERFDSCHRIIIERLDSCHRIIIKCLDSHHRIVIKSLDSCHCIKIRHNNFRFFLSPAELYSQLSYFFICNICVFVLRRLKCNVVDI